MVWFLQKKIGTLNILILCLRVQANGKFGGRTAYNKAAAMGSLLGAVLESLESDWVVQHHHFGNCECTWDRGAISMMPGTSTKFKVSW